MRQFKYLLAVFLTGLLVACGGGGGNPGTNPFLPAPTTPTPSLAVSIVNSGGVPVNGISVGTAYAARAVVLDGSGAPVSGVMVTFSLSDSSIAVLSPLTALTNASGIAQVGLSPASISSIGAAALSASSAVTGTPVSASMDFAVQDSNLTLSAVTVSNASLPSGGNTEVQVTALVNGAASTAIPVNVNFTVSCGKINGVDTAGGGVSVTTNGSGVAMASYDAVTSAGNLCSGNVTIAATSAGAVPSSATLNVAAPTANAVVFVSATPAQIFLSKSGAVDQSRVVFRVLSSAGTPMAGIPVQFSIPDNSIGVGLGATGSIGPKTATTNVSGEASISVFSGTIPGPVKVRAQLVSSPSVYVDSQNLTVASGPPSQRFMSLSVEKFNIEGSEYDGSSTQLTVRIADRQGNAVVDGTVVNFTTEGGQIGRSCSTVMTNGISQCSVTLQSQNPKPSNGRVSVLAYLEGTKDYVDTNGNNQYDAGDTLINQGEAYRDDNENGAYDTGEFLVPRFGSQACAGSGAPFPSRANTCDSTLATTVRQQAVILFSASKPSAPYSVVFNGSSVAFNLGSWNDSRLPLPAGTTVIPTITSVQGSCAVNGSALNSPIPNTSPGTNPSANLATRLEIGLTGCAPGDQIQLNVKVPSGLTTPLVLTLPALSLP